MLFSDPHPERSVKGTGRFKETSTAREAQGRVVNAASPDAFRMIGDLSQYYNTSI